MTASKLLRLENMIIRIVVAYLTVCLPDSSMSSHIHVIYSVNVLLRKDIHDVCTIYLLDSIMACALQCKVHDRTASASRGTVLPALLYAAFVTSRGRATPTTSAANVSYRPKYQSSDT